MKGETYRIDVSLFNPLPAPLSISAFEIVQASFQLRCITARKMLIPAHSSITTAMYVIPESCGELTLNQIRVRVGGCVEHRSTSVTCGASSTPPSWSRCRVRFPVPSSCVGFVIPSFPQLPITLSSLPSSFARGEVYPFTLSLRCVKEKIEDVTLHIKLIRGEQDKLIRGEQDKLIRGEQEGDAWVFEG